MKSVCDAVVFSGWRSHGEVWFEVNFRHMIMCRVHIYECLHDRSITLMRKTTAANCCSKKTGFSLVQFTHAIVQYVSRWQFDELLVFTIISVFGLIDSYITLHEWGLTLCARKYLCARFGTYTSQIDHFGCNFRYGRGKWLLGQDSESPEPGDFKSCLILIFGRPELEIHSAQ